MRLTVGVLCLAAELGSLQSVVANEDLSFIFVGGKGGVGKTTTSSALACLMAERRLKAGKKGVLLISTDPAHSLSDAFRKDLSGGKAVETGFPGLSVIEIDPTEALGKEMKSWSKLVKQANMD